MPILLSWNRRRAVFIALAAGAVLAAIGQKTQPLLILGAGFALLYEVRGSLIPSLVAHALTNGVTLGFLYGVVGS